MSANCKQPSFRSLGMKIKYKMFRESDLLSCRKSNMGKNISKLFHSFFWIALLAIIPSLSFADKNLISPDIRARNGITKHSRKCQKQRTFKNFITEVSGLSNFPCAYSDTSEFSFPIRNSQVEPTVSIGFNPINSSYPMVVVGYQNDRYISSGGAASNMMQISLDGGKTFGPPIGVPDVACFGESPITCNNCPTTLTYRTSDPNVAISPKGAIYFGGLPFNINVNSVNGVSISKYNVLSNVWEYSQIPHVVSGTGEGPDNPITDFDFIVVDPKDQDGNTVYMTWEDFYFADADFTQGRGTLQFIKTTDGVNFTAPVSFAPTPAELLAQFGGDVDPETNLMVLLKNPGKPYSKIVSVFNFVGGSNNGIVSPFASLLYSTVSSDQGSSWSTPIPFGPQNEQPLGQVVDPQNLDLPIRGNVQQLVSDQKNDVIYCVKQIHSLIGDGIPTGIVLFVSTDSAESWQNLGLVNLDQSVQAFCPSISLADDSGTLAISYYDFRNHEPNSEALETDRWMAFYSFNKKTGTLKFKNEIRLTPESFNLRNGPLLFPGSGAPVPSGLFIGDYQQQKTYKNKIYNSYAIVPVGSTDINDTANIQLSIVSHK